MSRSFKRGRSRSRSRSRKRSRARSRSRFRKYRPGVWGDIGPKALVRRAVHAVQRLEATKITTTNWSRYFAVGNTLGWTGEYKYGGTWLLNVTDQLESGFEDYQMAGSKIFVQRLVFDAIFAAGTNTTSGQLGSEVYIRVDLVGLSQEGSTDQLPASNGQWYQNNINLNLDSFPLWDGGTQPFGGYQSQYAWTGPPGVSDRRTVRRIKTRLMKIPSCALFENASGNNQSAERNRRIRIVFPIHRMMQLTVSEAPTTAQTNWWSMRGNPYGQLYWVISYFIPDQDTVPTTYNSQFQPLECTGMCQIHFKNS